MSDTPKMTPLDMTPPKPGRMQKLADDLYWIRFTLPFRLNHINLFALDTDTGWLLLDCGIKGTATAAQWQILLDGPLGGRPIAGIIVSHYHADHIGYAAALAGQTGAPIFMGSIEHEQALWRLNQTDADYAAMMATTYRRFGLADTQIESALSNGNYYRSLVDDLPGVTLVDATHQFVTKAGSWQVRFDAGHSPGHMSLIDIDRQLYICIDFLLPRISPNISAKLHDLSYDMLGDYLHYLDQMRALPADFLVIPSHDWPYYGGASRAEQLCNHHAARLDELANVIDGTPISTNDAMLALFPFNMNDHEIFFASCEARAHLNHLKTQGRLSHSVNKSNIDLFA